MRRAIAVLVLGGVVLGLAGCGRGPDQQSEPRAFRVAETVSAPTRPGDVDLGLLVPQGARTRRAWNFAPGQILVEWVSRRQAFIYAREFTGRWGLVLWTRQPSSGFLARWRSFVLPLSGRVATGSPNIWIGFGDVSGDRRRDVMVAEYSGNHACGPHRVVATFPDRPRVIFRKEVCETFLSARSGRLEIDAPEYVGDDSVCCPSFRRVTLMAWSGTRLVAVSSRRVSQRDP